jgi:hypothetical protein
MKKEYPVLWAKVSTVIGTPILFVTMVIYVQRIIVQPSVTLYPLAVTAFGITAALSGICFRMRPSLPEDSTPRYAGEKFLHSALLLIQTIFLIYAKDSLMTFGWVNSHEPVKMLVSGVAAIVVFFLSGVAVVCWFHGFYALNNELWQNWKRRTEIINKGQENGQNGKSQRRDENAQQSAATNSATDVLS